MKEKKINRTILDKRRRMMKICGSMQQPVSVCEVEMLMFSFTWDICHSCHQTKLRCPVDLKLKALIVGKQL
jgi:MinD superfamily P-loop ATPase